MKARRASDLAKSLIIDIDGAIAGVSRPVEDRHSAAASALITVARLAGGVCINLARIASAMEDIAYSMEKSDDNDGATVRRSEAEREVHLGSGSRPDESLADATPEGG